jgi:ribulose 1,5-bisphosphate synthetase/thiazole synthase
MHINIIKESEKKFQNTFNEQNTLTKFDIIIVGAGAAGLSLLFIYLKVFGLIKVFFLDKDSKTK